MSNPIVIYKGRTKILPVHLGFDISGDTITSQIRDTPAQSGILIATWTVTVDSAPAGDLTLRLDNDVTVAITQVRGYMDLKRVVGGEPLPVFENPLEVVFREAV